MSMTLLIKSLPKSQLEPRSPRSAFAQSAKDICGASPYVAVEKEPAPKLIVDPSLSEGLAHGIFWAEYRAEKLAYRTRVWSGALQVSPRIGQLHDGVVANRLRPPLRQVIDGYVSWQAW